MEVLPQYARNPPRSQQEHLRIVNPFHRVPVKEGDAKEKSERGGEERAYLVTQGKNLPIPTTGDDAWRFKQKGPEDFSQGRTQVATT